MQYLPIKAAVSDLIINCFWLEKNLVIFKLLSNAINYKGLCAISNLICKLYNIKRSLNHNYHKLNYFVRNLLKVLINNHFFRKV